MARKPKITGFSQEQVDAARTFRDSSAKNTPKTILDAFFPARVQIAEINIYPVDLGHFLLLEQIENPLALSIADGVDRPTKFAHLAQGLLLLSMPFDAAAQLVADRTKFDATVLDFSTRIPASEILAAGQAVRTAIQSAFATAIPTRGDGASTPRKGGGDDPLPDSSPAARS